MLFVFIRHSEYICSEKRKHLLQDAAAKSFFTETFSDFFCFRIYYLYKYLLMNLYYYVIIYENNCKKLFTTVFVHLEDVKYRR